MADDPQVSVVIVAYRSGATLRRCLADLKAQTFRDFEVLLVDNASGDGAPQAAAAADPDLRLIEAGGNLGFAAGNNLGAERARGRWLVLLNPDAYPRPGWLQALAAEAAAWPQVRCFTSRQLMAADPARLDGLGDAMAWPGLPFRGGYGLPDPQTPPQGEVFSPCGAAMMIDRALFLRLGGFSEDFFCYCEDADLGYRLRLRGEAVRLAPGAAVLHEGSASTGGRRSDFSLFHGARNRLWTFVRCTPPALFALTLGPHLAATAALLLAAVLKGEGRPVLRGLAAAVRGLPRVWGQRRAIQAARTAGSAQIAAMMSWDLSAVAGRRWTVRPSPARRGARPAGP